MKRSYSGLARNRLDMRGFTLIELMIVIAIIGILASIAIPSYSQYIIRSQLSEPISLMAGAKVPMAEFYADKSRWPASAASTMSNLSGKYVSLIEITSSAGGSMVLTATMRATGVNATIAGKKVTYSTADGGRQWSCGSSEVDAMLLPSACR
jgi:type IV pilus assembly protein PilA